MFLEINSTIVQWKQSKFGKQNENFYKVLNKKYNGFLIENVSVMHFVQWKVEIVWVCVVRAREKKKKKWMSAQPKQMLLTHSDVVLNDF